MLLKTLHQVILASLLAHTGIAKPVAAPTAVPVLEKKAVLTSRNSSGVDLTDNWNQKTLFSGTLENDVYLDLVCDKCTTEGTISAALNDFSAIQALKDVASFKDASPSVHLALTGFNATFDLNVTANLTAPYTKNLFTSEAPWGFGFDTTFLSVDIGAVFLIDLVFNIDAGISLTGGFTVAIPDASVDVDIFDGTVKNSSFAGAKAGAIPITVTSGSATFQADLRLRVEIGATASTIVSEVVSKATSIVTKAASVVSSVEGKATSFVGSEFHAVTSDIASEWNQITHIFRRQAGGDSISLEVGIYINLMEFVAKLESPSGGSGPSCKLEAEEYFDINIGAFANADVATDYTSFGAIPTKSSTILTLPTWTQCAMTGAITPASSGAFSAGISSAAVAASASTPVSRTMSPSPSFSPASSSSVKRISSSTKSSTSLATSENTLAGRAAATTLGSVIAEYIITTCAANSIVHCPASLQHTITTTASVDSGAAGRNIPRAVEHNADLAHAVNLVPSWDMMPPSITVVATAHF